MFLRSGSLNLKGMFDTCSRFGCEAWETGTRVLSCGGCAATAALTAAAAACAAAACCATTAAACWATTAAATLTGVLSSFDSPSLC